MWRNFYHRLWETRHSLRAEAYGSLLFSDDVREDNNQKVSADFSEQEIKTIICSTVCSSRQASGKRYSMRVRGSRAASQRAEH